MVVGVGGGGGVGEKKRHTILRKEEKQPKKIIDVATCLLALHWVPREREQKKKIRKKKVTVGKARKKAVWAAAGENKPAICLRCLSHLLLLQHGCMLYAAAATAATVTCVGY